MSNPGLSIYFDRVLSEESMEAVSTSLHCLYNRNVIVDDELIIQFSTSRDESGSFETTALVWFPTDEDKSEGEDDADADAAAEDDEDSDAADAADFFDFPYVPRLIVPAKYKDDFIHQQVLFRHPELKFTPFTEPSGKEMMYVEFVEPYVFPDIKARFNSLCEFIYQQENPRPRGPRFTNLKVED